MRVPEELRRENPVIRAPLWRVSVNGDDWVEVEALTAAHAASDVCLRYYEGEGERREIDLLIVRKAERPVVPRGRNRPRPGEPPRVEEQ